MESPPSSASGPFAAADYPRWVMLDRGGRLLENSTGDASTSASCYSSTGHAVQVSFRFAPPPAVSTLHVDERAPGAEIPGKYNEPYTYHVLVSARRDSVLIKLYTMSEYFVYIAGGGGARPPRLLLLPPRGAGMVQGHNSTGILRRGGDEFVVASLVMSSVPRHVFRPQGPRGDGEDRPVEASMCILRSGECKWEHRTGIPVHHAEGQERELSWWQTSSVIAVGDRYLYWIDLTRGIIFSDVTAEVPELRYVPLPPDPLIPGAAYGHRGGGREYPEPEVTRNVCVTVAGAVRFVRASPRCCCGGPGATLCARSRRAFTITTWTLRMDDMTWEEDATVGSGEPWAAAAAAATGIPLVPPAFPVVSIEDPGMVCFLSSESVHQRQKPHYGADKAAWLVAVDTKTKALRSVWRYPEDEDDNQEQFHQGRQVFLPSEVSSYFNATTCHGGGDNLVPASGEDHKEERQVLAASQKDEEERQEVLAAIQEIPGMARDEMLRAHSVLTGDDRRVRFLAELPVDMRKEYCMIMTELERNLRLAK